MSTTIEKHGFYAYMKGLEKGLGLLVFDISDTVSGVKLCVGKSEKFSMNKKDFENLINYGIIEFVQIVPKYVWKDFKKVYNN